jgi:hypothetical protein
MTSWPAVMSSGTTADPIQPDAPVTKTRMGRPPVQCQLLSSL